MTTTISFPVCGDCGCERNNYKTVSNCWVCGGEKVQPKADTLDKMTYAVTAFNSFEEFMDAMRAGYVPTIRQDSTFRRQLTQAIRNCGFKVFDGVRVA